MRDGPPHREVQGHGRLVVVVGVTPHQGAEESSAQGEGAEVSVAERHAGVRDAQRLACRSASRASGDQARESRVLGNGHALFGEGRTEKARQQDLAGRLLYLVVLHEDKDVIAKAQETTATWLATMGLELKPSKTRITHTLTETDGQVGFDFLGWQIRQHPVGRTHSGKKASGERLGFKTIITPSKDAQRRHQDRLADVIDHHQTATQAVLIGALTPVIRGWVNYHSTCVAKAIFSKMSALTFAKLLSWAKRRHPTKSAGWVTEKYWRHTSGPTWNFAVTKGPQLFVHNKRAIVRHIKVRGTKSPFDGDWAYWGERLGRYPSLPAEEAHLLKRQHGRCVWCGLHFRSEDRREIDHIQPLSLGGHDVSHNRQLLHGHCHDAKTARDDSPAAEVPMTKAP